MTETRALFVSTSGDDAADGSEGRPFRTLARAVAARRGAGKPTTVFVREGTHYLAEPLCLHAADSGLTLCAGTGETPVISGGVRLALAWKPFRDGIWQARVPAGFDTDQLFVNGERQILARYPNVNPAERIFNGYAADCLSPERVRRWANPAGGYLHAMHSHLWGGFHYRITGCDPAGNAQLEGGWQNNRKSSLHAEYRFVEGIFEELDAPGEWFLDRAAGMLHFYPPSGLDLRTALVEGVHLRHLVEFCGSAAQPVRDVAIRGVTFRHAARTFMETREPLLRSDWTLYRGGAVLFTGSEDCCLENCFLDQLGGNAVMVSGYSRRVAVSGCRIDQAGAGGVSFVGLPMAVRSPLFEYAETLVLEQLDRTPGPQTDDYPADCLVNDCLITRVGRTEKQAAGVQIAMARRITVRHCSIYDVPRAGINIGDGCWGGHLIEGCDVFDTVKETGDHGSFNSWGRDRYWVADIRETDRRVAAAPELPLLDTVEPIVLRHNRWRCDHGWDIDLDDGSTRYVIENNLCLHGGIKLREGYRRVVRNNIMVNNTLHPHVWYADSHDVVGANIVFSPYQPIRVRPPWGDACDHNLEHRAGRREGQPATELQAQSGRDAHSQTADAGFVDPAQGDYRVRPDSPALALGFRNFPMDNFGVRSSALRALARTPCLPRPGEQTPAFAPQRDRASMHWHGSEVRNVAGWGDVSAAGLPGEIGVWGVASSGDLLEGDVIQEVDGVEIWGTDSLLRLATPPARITVWRNQQRVTVPTRHVSAT